jgi:signal transduction histidine kinase/CheY-like chemotaxis protein/PAS domain-containing protein
VATRASSYGSTSETNRLDIRLPIEAVIITSELNHRPTHERDLASEHLAVTALMEDMANTASTTCGDRILQRLVDTTLSLCRADSAGMSMLEMDGAREVFRWRAMAGRWAHHAGGSIDRHRSACGLVLDTNAPVLMAQPHRHYGVFPGFEPIAELLLIPFHFEDRPVGTLWVVRQDEDGPRFDAEDLQLLTRLARYASIAYRLMLTQDRTTQLRLEAELADSRLLQDISTQLIIEKDEKGFRERLLDAAISIMHSDCASLQMFKEDGSGGGYLDLIASHGFSQETIDRWQSVTSKTLTTCGEVLRSGRRVIVTDVTKCEFMSDSEDLLFFLKGGIHAVQSTPLLSRSGRLLGAFSTHWHATHSPSDRDLRLLDILARQAADLLERMMAEERLRDNDRRKEEFLATLAHELRNPLAPILNAVQFLNLMAPVAQEVQWAREVIVRQTMHLTRMVDDLLDVSRINTNRLELKREPVDLARVVHMAVETTQPFVTKRNHTVSVVLPTQRVMLDADPMRLSQVFANLINNAAKFSSQGRDIEVSAEVQGDRVRVRVRDHGIGIAATELPDIFDLFKRVASPPEREEGGLGIGLTLVKRLVEMHGGSVSAGSAGLGLGSDFVVQLPIVTSVGDGQVTVEGSSSVGQGHLRVLIVDDHEDGAMSMCRLLRVLGYDARQACDGLAGFAAAEEFRPDAVLLDIGMPKLNGYDVARRLRSETWGKSMFLIAVTGWGQASDKQRATDAGFDEHLTKPVAVTELQRALSSIVTQSQDRVRRAQGEAVREP